MKKLALSMMTLLCALSLAARAADEAEKEALKPQTKCPIMGGKINKASSIDVRGQRVYVCCPGCLGKIEADPEAALAKLQENGEYAESLQKTCPVMKGRKVNPKLFVEYKGRRLYVCCKGCLKAVAKDPAKHADLIAEQVAKDAEEAAE